jgi:hypothetical protein
MLAVGAIVTLLYGAQLNESYLNWVNGGDPDDGKQGAN